jgi:hypothetical protein
MMRSLRRSANNPLLVIVVAGVLALAGLCAYGLHRLQRRGGSFWVSVAADDPRLSASMRLALGEAPPAVEAGPVAWRSIDQGFDVAELPVSVGGRDVDRPSPARIDPAHFHFVVRTAPSGDRELGDWMTALGAALVINGSSFSPQGTPATPAVSERVLLGPRDSAATHGALAASDGIAGLHDFAGETWAGAFEGADVALVSCPLPLATDGTSRVRCRENCPRYRDRRLLRPDRRRD